MCTQRRRRGSAHRPVASSARPTTPWIAVQTTPAIDSGRLRRIGRDGDGKRDFSAPPDGYPDGNYKQVMKDGTGRGASLRGKWHPGASVPRYLGTSASSCIAPVFEPRFLPPYLQEAMPPGNMGSHTTAMRWLCSRPHRTHSAVEPMLWTGPRHTSPSHGDVATPLPTPSWRTVFD